MYTQSKNIPFGLHVVASFGHSQSSGAHEHDSISHLERAAAERVRHSMLMCVTEQVLNTKSWIQ